MGVTSSGCVKMRQTLSDSRQLEEMIVYETRVCSEASIEEVLNYFMEWELVGIYPMVETGSSFVQESCIQTRFLVVLKRMGKIYENQGNNPEPIKSEGRCCHECNYAVVVPKRVQNMTESRKGK